MKRVELKLLNMRKAQSFVVYKVSNREEVIIQSGKSIGIFNKDTGKGLLNTKGCYFHHLNKLLGAIEFDFSPHKEEILKVLFKSGDLIGTSPETGPVYMA